MGCYSNETLLYLYQVQSTLVRKSSMYVDSLFTTTSTLDPRSNSSSPPCHFSRPHGLVEALLAGCVVLTYWRTFNPTKASRAVLGTNRDFCHRVADTTAEVDVFQYLKPDISDLLVAREKRRRDSHTAHDIELNVRDRPRGQICLLSEYAEERAVGPAKVRMAIVASTVHGLCEHSQSALYVPPPIFGLLQNQE